VYKDDMDSEDLKRRAVALGYNPAHDNAPKVLATGRGATAKKIMEIARKHGITLMEDPVLVELLAQVEVDQEIPPILYQAVAEVLAFVYSLDRGRRETLEGEISAPHG
jgi:flagellar biosynthesis protein